MKNSVRTKIVLMVSLSIVCLISGFFVDFKSGHFVGNFILFVALVTDIILSLSFGCIQGLVFSMLIIVLYSGVVIYQSLIGEMFVINLNYFWIAVFPLVALLAGCLGRMIREVNDDLEECLNVKDALITKDEETGFGNAREFYEDLKGEMSASKRYTLPLTVAIIEIQYVDELMSIYGRDSYSKILDITSSILIKECRVEDSIYRVSEKTFAIIMKHTPLDGANVLKSRIKGSLASINTFQEKKYQEYRIEVRIGIAELSDEIGTEFEFKKKAEREIELDV